VEESSRRGVSRETWIFGVATAVAVGAMAIDHLVGTESDGEDSGLVDPVTFGISVGLSLVVAAVLSLWVVPRAKAKGPGRAAAIGLLCSVLSAIPGIAFLWLGFPFVVAGAGIALGLVGRHGERSRLATAAVVVGVGMLAFGAGLYIYAAST
jgi:hypothetical protein